MLINPLPYGDDPHAPLNSKPWRNMKRGAELDTLVDADIFTYAAGFAVEHCEYMAYDADDNLLGHFSKKSLYNAWAKKNPDIEVADLDWYEWIEPLKTSEIIINRKKRQIGNVTKGSKQLWFLTKGSTLWRNDDATIQEYKGNRKEMRKPKYYEELREYMMRVMHAKLCQGLEADDSVASTARNFPGEVIVCSGDKDLLTIPGLHLNPSKLKEGVHFVSELDACRFLYAQMLSGDKIDNIKGLSGTKESPGWGAIKSAKAMANLITEYDMARYVAEQYAKRYPDGTLGYDGNHLTWQEMLVETANLLFLRRYQHTQFTWSE
ncbi:PIN domain-like protein [Vibrio phage 1.077.O._10N.261.45.A10]|nr:PIN domain-like protein [Vibrio phage 1.070.O._10N.261.45.B2]AUR85621.1 PIN domain-like protein [Vibrio phage 1.077.O._10N.261.45.A10]